ncbi:MAG: cation:proton antiporter, partial [Pseudomonadota bacterium]
AALAITTLFRMPRRDGFLVAASLAQIGEFSFILAGVGLALGVMGRETHDLILAAALISIVANPFVFRLADWLCRRPPDALPATE